MENYDKYQSLKEKNKHGDTLFPFEIYHNKSKTNLLYHHWHEEVEIIYFKKGRAEFSLNSTTYDLNEGEMLVVNRGVIHSGKTIDNKESQFYSIVFDLNMLNSRTEDNSQLKYITPLLEKKYQFQEYLAGKENWTKKVLTSVKKIIKLYESQKIKNGFELKIKSLLYETLFHFFANQGINKTNKYSQYDDRLKQILNYIHTNYDQKLKLEDMAEEINLSKYYFCKFFKKYVGKTPIEYLNYYRINKAIELLQKTDKRIMDIALDVGFDNNSYFIKVFKEIKDCTPVEFRDKMDLV